MELEKETSNINYWKDLLVIVDEEVRALRKQERTQNSEYEAAMGRREGIHTAVVAEVTTIFKGKTASQLVALQTMIEGKIATPKEGVDISYWESLLGQLKAHIARARLRDRHQENLRKKLLLLKAQQGLAAAREERQQQQQQEELGITDEIKTEPTEDEPQPPGEEGGEDDDVEETFTADNVDDATSTASDAEKDMLEPCFAAYESGRYSPVYTAQIEPGQLVYSEHDDVQRLEFARARVQGRALPATSDLMQTTGIGQIQFSSISPFNLCN